MKTLVISFLGKDKPGIVDQLSRFIQENQGNWQISSMHKISGLFAGIIEISIDDAHIDNLLTALDNYPDLTFQFVVCESDSTEAVPIVTLEITANDRLGIVNEISSAIHRQGGNLIRMVSKRENAAHTGQMLFMAKVTATITNAEDKEQLIQGLENLADDLIVDIL